MLGAPLANAPVERPRLRLGIADAALVALSLLLSGAGSLWLGQDLNFDLLSYHFYNGWALATGRFEPYLAPVGWHTFISPAMDAFSYLGMAGLPARAFGFLFGALHGLNVALVYLLALAVLWERPHARALAALAALVSGLGPNAVSLLGTTMGNNLVSLPVLAALLLLLWPLRDGQSPVAAAAWPASRLLGAAALCGAATGLRLTAAADHVSVVVVLLLFTAARRSARGLAVAVGLLGLGSLLGYLATNGFWAARLLERFGNPVFPLANQIFHSPYFESSFLRDPRWVANGALDYLRPPLDLALGRMDRLQEIGGRDARYLALGFAALAFLGLALAGRRPWRALLSAAAPGGFVLAYWLAGYLVWAAAFYYYRYMTTLELIAPLALLLLLVAILPKHLALPAACALSLVLVAWSRPHSWGRGDWQENWFGLDVPELARRPGALVLLAGGPLGYALPSFPADARFAHLTAIREKGGSELFDRALAEAIEAQGGPLLLLASFRVDARAQDPGTRRPRWTYDPEEDVGPAAARFGLRLTERCEDMRTRRGRLYLCEVEKATR